MNERPEPEPDPLTVQIVTSGFQNLMESTFSGMKFKPEQLKKALSSLPDEEKVKAQQALKEASNPAQVAYCFALLLNFVLVTKAIL